MARPTKETKKLIAEARKQWEYEEDWDGERRKTGRVRCPECRRAFPLDIMEVDHIRPKKLRGGDFIDNTRLLCPPCNKRKGSKLERVGPKTKKGVGASRVSGATKKATTKGTAAKRATKVKKVERKTTARRTATSKAMAAKKPTTRKASASKKKTTAKRTASRKATGVKKVKRRTAAKRTATRKAPASRKGKRTSTRK
ncbi:MAG: HNH endonuclease [Chloroflexi bacterium]|nr:HNH endonuclease [Chloroflexota bacterium]